MSPEAVATSGLDSKTDQVFFPQVGYEPILSLEESWGGKARKLWEQRFAETAELASDSVILYTGIGGAPIENAQVPVRTFGDGSQVPLKVKLEEQFGRVPRLLFLIASAFSSENVLNFRSVAREYKEQGVERIIAVLSSLAHERQDHEFPGETGEIILQTTTLKDVIDDLTLGQYVDGGILVQSHSLRSTELALRKNFPLLPIDAYNLLLKRAELKKIISPFVLGPDKGRKDEARILAAQLNCPMGSAIKNRKREDNGDPDIFIPKEVLRYIKENRCHVVVADDEIREAGTMEALAVALEGYAEEMTIIAVKGIFARVSGKLGEQPSKKTAVDRLVHPLIKRIVITDATKPIVDVSPIKDKLEIVELGPELRALTAYLQNSLIDPANPSWLRDPKQTGTLLRLDLSVEQFE